MPRSAQSDLPDPDQPATRLPRLDEHERARLIAEAQEHSRRLKDDPVEQALLDEIESLQAENSDLRD